MTNPVDETQPATANDAVESENKLETPSSESAQDAAESETMKSLDEPEAPLQAAEQTSEAEQPAETAAPESREEALAPEAEAIQETEAAKEDASDASEAQPEPAPPEPEATTVQQTEAAEAAPPTESEPAAETPSPLSEEASAPAEAAAVETPDKASKPSPATTPQDAAATEEDGDAAPPEEGGEETSEDFEALLEQYDQYKKYRPGDIVTGVAVSIGEQDILLDIGARVEGSIPISELPSLSREKELQEGDEITAMVCRFEKSSQYIPLSFERARVSKIWDTIEHVAEEDQLIDGIVVEKVKGGFIVDIGVRAFLPTSLATLRPQKDYQDLLGKKFQFKITKLQRRRGNIILSRKEILKDEQEQNRAHLLETLDEGAVLNGIVKNVTDYGAFIDLGGLDGLLHITDMSWGRVKHPKEMLELNQELDVKVLRIDREKEKVSLGLKQITPDPWLSAPEKYPVGTSVRGTVLNLTGFGAFLELEPGVEGLIHVSELSWTKKIRNPAQVLKKGDEVDVRVLGTDVENRRVSLSLRQVEENPWDTLAERFPVGSKVKGKVRNITDFGAFVEIEDGIDGLVHVSDFRWGERNANPTDYVEKGKEQEVVVLAVDSESKKVSLGIKQLTPDPWIEYTNKHREGDVVQGTITRITDFGVVVRLNEFVEGFIRQVALGLPRNKKISEDYSEGQDVTASITRISHRDRKVDLSIKRYFEDQERQAIREYTQGQDSGGATFGDIMKHIVK